MCPKPNDGILSSKDLQVRSSSSCSDYKRCIMQILTHFMPVALCWSNIEGDNFCTSIKGWIPSFHQAQCSVQTQWQTAGLIWPRVWQREDQEDTRIRPTQWLEQSQRQRISETVQSQEAERSWLEINSCFSLLHALCCPCHSPLYNFWYVARAIERHYHKFWLFQLVLSIVNEMNALI